MERLDEPEQAASSRRPAYSTRVLFFSMLASQVTLVGMVLGAVKLG